LCDVETEENGEIRCTNYSKGRKRVKKGEKRQEKRVKLMMKAKGEMTGRAQTRGSG
jgi:hypothetical protein